MAVKSHDQITITDITDAYSVGLTKESHTFSGGVNGVAAGATCSTQAYALLGGVQCNTVNVTKADITCPTGIVVDSVANSGTKNPTITFKTTATISSDCEATIPVSVDDVTVNLVFSFAVAKSGASLTITSTTTEYVQGDNGTTPPTTGWGPSVPSVAQGKYLWTRVTVTYSDNTTTTSYSVSYFPTNGTSVTIKSRSVTYQEHTNGTTAPTGTWTDSIPNVAEGKYLWTKTVVTYSDNTSTTAYSVSYNAVDGEPAITVAIRSSNGTVFKNSSGSTVLTAHVYVGGVEQTVATNGAVGTNAAYGYVKWYEGSSTTAVETSKTHTVNASAVISTLVVTAQVEK